MLGRVGFEATGAAVADFNFGYRPIDGRYPTASPGVYVVGAGDTLQSIARNAYGDSALWYRLAEANGLGSNNDLKVGQSLTIPNRVDSQSNSASTFKPYNPGDVTGSTTPNVEVPQPQGEDDDCGGIGQIIVAIVVVVVAVVSQQYYLLEFAGEAAVAAGTVSTGTTIAAGAAAGATASIAGQIVGNALGIQNGFSWKQVALGAIGGGISAGIGGIGGQGGVNFTGATEGASTLGNRIIQGAVGNALTQGVGVVTGLQERFDWRGVAASAAGAGVGSAVGSALGGVKFGFNDFGNQLVRGTLTGLAAGTTAAVMRGGRVSVQQIATDAFGNALGSSLAGGSFNGASQNEAVLQGAGPWSERDYVNGLDLQSDNYNRNRQSQPYYDQIVEAFGGDSGPRYPGVQVADAGRLTLSGVTSDSDDAYYAGIIAKAQARDVQRQAAVASGRRLDAQATSNLYATGAGDVRETTPAFIPTLPEITVVAPRMTPAEMQAFDRLSPGVDSIAPMGELDGILTFNRAGQALRGAGNFAYDAWMTGPRAVVGLGNLAQDAVGYAANSISPNHSVLTGEAFAYQPRSALMQSVQQQGVLGTLGTGLTGVVRNAPGIGLVGALGAPNRNWGNIGGQVLNTGMAGVGMAAGMRPMAGGTIDFSTGRTFAPGFYRADPAQLRFMQPTVSPNFSNGGTIASLADDLRANRVRPDQVGDPLRIVMVDGKPFSFDNRRIVSYNLAGETNVPIRIVGMDDATFASQVRERFNPIRGEGLQAVVVPASQREAVIRDLYNQGLVRSSR